MEILLICLAAFFASVQPIITGTHELSSTFAVMIMLMAIAIGVGVL